MNLYIKNKNSRRAVAWLIAFPIWLIFMYGMGHLVFYCCTHMGMAGCLPPLIIAYIVYNLLETRVQKIKSKEILQRRRIKFDKVRHENY